MNSSEIKNILRNPYNREDWKNLYRNIFQGKVTFFDEPYQYEIKEEIVESLLQIGYLTLDDEYIVALFEVNIKSNVNVLSKKIGLRKIISKYISEDKFNGVLTIFENGSDDYRFTFASKTTKVTEEGVFVSETSSKRFTYILGKNEPCITPSQRFENLLKKNGSINIDDVIDAFSVEKLNKEFFNGYKEHYELLCNYFYESKNKKKIFLDDEKLIRDFVKRFLGRIVFLYFVQKKGWLGVKKGENWGTGDHQFLSNIFKSFSDKPKFYSKVISKIFFDYLSVERENDVVNLEGNIFTRIPYLNGGLFELESVDKNEIDFNESDLKSLFDFFDKFNFTIYEDDPNEQTVAVDPEMLGHIFENLLEDNKDKGAFYTPKEIVHYMCQESLIEYLTTWFKNKGYTIRGFSSFSKPEEQKLFSENEGRFGQLLIETNQINTTKVINRSIIENLLKKKIDLIDKTLIKEHINEFQIALDSVKICDPAIGSGAFPMGLLQEIYYTKQTLWNFEYDNLNNFPSSEVKLNIIQNSIYGVDIEKGAVDIARLRFWLSLIVDEDEPKSLPNLDFKIVVGNSLVGIFENEVIEIDWDIKFKNVDSVKKMILNQQTQLYQLEHLQHLYFQAYTDKVSLSKDIKRLKIDILKNQLNLSKYYFNENNPILGGFIPSESDNKKNQSNKVYLDRISNIIFKLDSLEKDENLNYFDWKLNFPEIFNSKITGETGFDIIIGNPPYIGQSGNRDLFRVVLESEFGKKFHQRRMDYFYFFFHKSISICKDNGVIAFITTNYFLNSTYGDKLRKDFFDNCEFIHLINFNESRVFESALGQHNAISILVKEKNENRQVRTVVTSKKGLIGSKELHNILYDTDSSSKYFKFKSKDIFELPKYHILIEGNGEGDNSSEKTNLLFHLKSNNHKLVDFVDIIQGVVTGANDLSEKYKVEYNIKAKAGDGIFILQKEEIEKLNLNEYEMSFVKPWFKNSDIRRFSSNKETTQYIIYITSQDVIDLKKIPNLIKHFEKYKLLLINRNVRTGKYSLPEYDKFIEGNFDIPYVMIKSSFKKGFYFLVSYSRDKNVFEGTKLICPQRSPTNTFAYNDCSWFGATDIYFLKNRIDFNVDLKYILGILNSKLIYFWLYNKGQRKGEILQLFKDPLSEIPMVIGDKNQQKEIISLVSEIEENILKNYGIDDLENKLNKCVYGLFKLGENDIDIVENHK